MSRKTIWTTKTTGFLFKLSLKKYGPLGSWATKTLPRKGGVAQYDKWIEVMAKKIGSNAKGVKIMIGHATGAEWVGPRSFVFANSAALDAGFITNKQFNQNCFAFAKKMAKSNIRM